MSNLEEAWIDELLHDMKMGISLSSKMPYNLEDSTAEYAFNEAKLTIKSKLLEARLEAEERTHHIYEKELHYYKNLVEQYHHKEQLKIDPTPILQLQASAPTKKGE